MKLTPVITIPLKKLILILTGQMKEKNPTHCFRPISNHRTQREN